MSAANSAFLWGALIGAQRQWGHTKSCTMSATTRRVVLGFAPLSTINIWIP